MFTKFGVRSGVYSFVFGLLFPLVTFAQDVGVVLGWRADSADTGLAGQTVSGQSSPSLGVIVKSQLFGDLGLRFGAEYLTRSYQMESVGASQAHRFTYFSVPVGLMYRINEFGGFFVGPALNMTLEKNCGAGQACVGANSSLLALQVGGSFKFAPQLGAEIYFESALGSIHSGVTNPRAVVVNLMVTFD